MEVSNLYISIIRDVFHPPRQTCGILVLLLSSMILLPCLAGTSPQISLGMNFEHNWIYQGETMEVQILVRNEGSSNLEEIRISLDGPSGFSFQPEYHEIDISARRSKSVTFELLAGPNVNLGRQKISASASSNGEVLLSVFRFLEIEKTPLKIYGYDVNPGQVIRLFRETWPTGDQEVDISYGISNEGDDMIQSIDVEISVNRTAFSIIKGSKRHRDLGKGGDTGIQSLQAVALKGTPKGSYPIILYATIRDPNGRTHIFWAEKSVTIWFLIDW